MTDAEETAFREMFPLVIVGLAGMALLFLITALVISNQEDTYVPAGMTKTETVAERVAPIGEVNMGGPKVAQSSSASESDTSQKARSAKQVYNAVCSACHDNGTLGAPQFGKKSAWAARAKKGIETLVKHSYNGFKKMPAQKGSASRSEIEKTVKYMLDEAGVSP